MVLSGPIVESLSVYESQFFLLLLGKSFRFVFSREKKNSSGREKKSLLRRGVAPSSTNKCPQKRAHAPPWQRSPSAPREQEEEKGRVKNPLSPGVHTPEKEAEEKKEEEEQEPEEGEEQGRGRLRRENIFSMVLVYKRPTFQAQALRKTSEESCGGGREEAKRADDARREREDETEEGGEERNKREAEETAELLHAREAGEEDEEDPLHLPRVEVLRGERGDQWMDDRQKNLFLRCLESKNPCPMHSAVHTLGVFLFLFRFVSLSRPFLSRQRELVYRLQNLRGLLERALRGVCGASH